MSIVQNINGKAMNQEQIQQYFYKLQLNEFKPDVNLLTLKRIQYAHLRFIPYENFDILNGKITSLKRQDMFEKLFYIIVVVFVLN